MVDTAAAPPLKQPTSRRARSTALSNTNANAGAGANAPKPKPKAVASRYLAPFSKPRPAKSSVTTITSASPAKASAAERAQLTNAVATADAATTRTLSVAFQSPTYCLDTSSRARSVSPAAAAVFSPEKRRSTTAVPSVRSCKVSGTGQNTCPWPAWATAAAPSGHEAGAAAAAAASLEHSASSYKRTAGAARPRAFDETPRRASVDGANEYLRALSSAGSRDGLGADRPASGPRPSLRNVMGSSARIARDAVGTRSDRFAYPASTVPSPSPVKKRSLFNGLLSSPFSKLPLKKQQPPSKPVGSLFRTTESPSRPRRSMELPGHAVKLQGKASSFGSDMNVRQNKAEEEHQLKLLYNRHLQWRHANAQAAAVRSSQRAAAEKTLIGAWITILSKCKSIAVTKLQLQLLRNNSKLMAVLRGQIVYLEEWSSLERVYASSLSGTTLALNATVLRLPVSDGAMADIQALKNAVGSAIDVMQRIGNSTSIQLSKLSRLKPSAMLSSVSTGKCLGVPDLQSRHSRTYSDGTVQRLAVHTGFKAREALQSPRAEDTNEPEKAWAFSVVFRLPSPFRNRRTQIQFLKMPVCLVHWTSLDNNVSVMLVTVN
ncbi:hypothetical protein EJB05_40779, partial [Eragrostis curvula]